ncbi:inactive rhomboid protein 1 isoform X3 [Prorops nasuta]|uniref:inactive rhomboid protein 1 isoform X3 n=1 Tax=Prorops nasuta TaxID=863751 RepID=UPI0034CD8D51
MPTDDDYGRRERFLLHQHQIGQYGSSSSPVPGTTASSGNSQVLSNNPTDCYKQQHQQLDQQQTQIGIVSDHCDYGLRNRVSALDRHEKSTSDKAVFEDTGKGCTDQRDLSTGSGERFYQNQDRFVQGLHKYATSKSSQTLPQSGCSSDRYVRYGGELGNGHPDQRLGLSTVDRYQSLASNELRFQHTSGEPGQVVGGAKEYLGGNAVVSGSGEAFSPAESFPSPPSPAPANDRFVPPPPLSPSPSEKYASSQSLAGYPPADRILPPGSPVARYSTAPASPMPAKGFSPSDRLLANQQSTSPSASFDQGGKDQQRYSAPAAERNLSGSSPVLASIQAVLQNERGPPSITSGSYSTESKEPSAGRYTAAITTDRLLSSSPIHAPVPERFASKPSEKYHVESPVHERYHRQEPQTLHHDNRYATIATSAERFLSSSVNPEAAHQRYSVGTDSQGRRHYNNNSERPVEATVCQKYVDRSSLSSTLPSTMPSTPGDFGRYANYQEIASQRFSDLPVQQRCGQSSRGNERFGNDRYLSNSSPGHENARYSISASSTERLLANTSSSPSSSSETGSRYHFPYGSTGQSSISPSPPDGSSCGASSGGHRTNAYQSATSKSNADKYLQLSKSVQSGYVYNQATSNDHQFSIGPPQERYERYHHATVDRYSPARGMPADKYLSLPKAKDRFSARIVNSSSCGASVVTVGSASGTNTAASGSGATAGGSSAGCTDRNYGVSAGNGSYVPPNAHTPVERYVPQPPQEVLYSDRYVDRYVPASVHTPTDRYVPANDPGDPYMRRDLGFHHHYRLPPPAAYPYHQSHFRFRGFAYAAASPSRLTGSPGSSSSSSSTSNQRDGFSTSPLLRPKTRGASALEFASSARHVPANPPPSCCTEVVSNNRACCQPIRRSLPPATLPSITAQPTHSPWQSSPVSGTMATPTVPSSGPETEGSQNIGMYTVGCSSVGTSETRSSTPVTSSTVASTVSAVACSVPTGVSGVSGITRSVSAPSGSRPVIQSTPSTASTSATTPTARTKFKRTTSRTEAVRKYIVKETAKFFGVDEETEEEEMERWLNRRRRMAIRQFGGLVPEHRPPYPDITKDVPDSSEIPEGTTRRRRQLPVRRKDSVARMALSGLQYMVGSLVRRGSRERPTNQTLSRSFTPSVTNPEMSSEPENTQEEEEEWFFERPSSSRPSPAPLTPPQQQPEELLQAEKETTKSEDILEPTSGTAKDTPDELARLEGTKDERTTVDGQARRPRQFTRDHYTSRKTGWSRSRTDAGLGDPTRIEQQEDGVTLRRSIPGRCRISPATVDRIFDNSNRRQHGMRMLRRFLGPFRRSVTEKPAVRQQLDDFDDHRPFFTYWVSTVQVLVLIFAIAFHGFGPFGMDLKRRTAQVLVTSLSVQQVEYYEPANIWVGPRAADLVHLGGKFTPCMRRDIKILKEIDMWRERERDTACCIRNDDSGCVQSSKADCSNTISRWKKWGPGDSGPGGRISGSVCGLDPKFCDAPASIAPYEWPDDITKWPICRKTTFNQRFSKDSNQRGNANFPIGRYKDKMAEHMVCEVIGHPCCIGIHGMCRITTKEYCDFVHGYFHEEASLCSQVECLHDVCGMIPFLNPEWPDQFYRIFSTIFLHAGILHLALTLLIQFFFMRDLEKLIGTLRISLIYFVGGLSGNLASAIFIPYRAEVGPAGAHFALFAALIVEVLNCWPMIHNPRRTLTKLIMILIILLIIGLLPWVDNYAHFFGFIFGFLASYALMPFISFGHYDRRRRILHTWICLVLIVGLFALLLTLFYNIPAYECEICKYFTCIPITKDFCASQNINFNREEPV